MDTNFISTILTVITTIATILPSYSLYKQYQQDHISSWDHIPNGIIFKNMEKDVKTLEGLTFEWFKHTPNDLSDSKLKYMQLKGHATIYDLFLCINAINVLDIKLNKIPYGLLKHSTYTMKQFNKIDVFSYENIIYCKTIVKDLLCIMLNYKIIMLGLTIESITCGSLLLFKILSIYLTHSVEPFDVFICGLLATIYVVFYMIYVHYIQKVKPLVNDVCVTLSDNGLVT